MTAKNRRYFSRIAFDAPCQLHQGEKIWQSRVLDISLKGLLAEKPQDFGDADLTAPFEAVIMLTEEGPAIVMAVELKHQEEDQIGLHCQYIDLESATHLRRLVELNLGDETLLLRELARLGID